MALEPSHDLAEAELWQRETEEAVKRFQQVNSLPATGQVDRATWDRMAEEYDLTCRCDEV